MDCQWWPVQGKPYSLCHLFFLWQFLPALYKQIISSDDFTLSVILVQEETLVKLLRSHDAAPDIVLYKLHDGLYVNLSSLWMYYNVANITLRKWQPINLIKIKEIKSFTRPPPTPPRFSSTTSKIHVIYIYKKTTCLASDSVSTCHIRVYCGLVLLLL